MGGGGGVSTVKQCTPLFSTYHPLGSQWRRRAGATSSPQVASHIKAGDFSSAAASMLFLPILWVGVSARRVSGCTVIIPQVFGWREGPSHHRQKNRRVWAFLQVFKTRRHPSPVFSLLSCFCFLLLDIQEMFLPRSTTIDTGIVFPGLCPSALLSLHLSQQVGY